MTISAHQPGETTRYFHGLCISFSQGARNQRFSSYRAEVVPKVWLLTQTSQSRIFQNKTVPQIIDEVLEGYEVDNEIDTSGFKPRNYCVQYRESDWNFLSRIMEEEGIYYYFEHTAQNHKLILGNTPGSHRATPTSEKVTFALERSELEDKWIPSIYQWRQDDKMFTGKYELRDFHFQLPTNNLLAQHQSIFDIGKNKDLEVYDWPGEYAKRFDGINPSGDEDSSRLEPIFQDRERTVKIRQEELDVAYKMAHGVADNCAITAGYKFSLIDHPNKKANIDYIVVNAVHDAMQSPFYISDERVGDPYVVHFTCIPHGGGHAPFRPERKTRKPIVHGSQTAFVVGNPGDEIFTDKYGRVKVHFHWDRSDNNDQRASAWIRVGTMIAGNKWGTMFIPRVGQEVIVDFLEGDADQPIIVGAVYNEKNQPHYELDKFKTLSYIKTHSTPKAQGFNELRFEDKAKKEQVFVHSQKRYDLRVRGSMYETCGGSRNEVIGLKDPENPGGNLTVTVAGCHDFHIKEAEYIGVDQKRNEAVKAEVVEDYQSSLFTKVTTKASLNAKEIIMEAATKISLKVGASCIVIEPALITIAGQMVKINSGGYGTETGDTVIDDPLDATHADTGEPGYLDRPRTGGGTGGRNRRQLKSQHHAYPPRKDEDPRMTAFRNRLNDSAAGRHALEVYERNGIQTRFDNSDGYYYDSGTNTMTMNPDMDQNFQTTGFVHEMGHGEAAHENRQPDINTLSRADYIDQSLQEEAHGDALANQARRELIASGHNMSSAPAQSQAAYDRGYNNAVAAERARNPNATADELEAAGRRGGEAEILSDYRAGRVQTSTPGNPTYPTYYGNAWDGAHPAPAGP
jgi:type VI secretion system secreted protein VgrG